MGGNALNKKNIETVRISVKDYGARMSEFMVLSIEFNNLYTEAQFRYGFPIPIMNKEDYGDLDVIYTINLKFHEKLIEFLKQKFNSKGMVSNGSVKSLEWEKFQVDMIYVSKESFDYTLNWYSHGDHAAVQGRVYRYYGFKYGNDGLYYSFGTKSFNKDILVTRDFKDANNILGYKPLSYEYQYHEDDIFDHNISSPYVCKRIFQTKKMDRPRESQIRFYEWVEKQDIPEEFSSNLGLQLLRSYSKKLYMEVVLTIFWMHVREFFNPIRRKIRKTWYKYFGKHRSKNNEIRNKRSNTSSS